jgi:hypothetical protein
VETARGARVVGVEAAGVVVMVVMLVGVRDADPTPGELAALRARSEPTAPITAAAPATDTTTARAASLPRDDRASAAFADQLAVVWFCTCPGRAVVA